jgi:nucleoside-diphosphate-sugar epimerase
MNILLAGASGFMGRNFLLHAPEHHRIIAVYRRDAQFPEFVSKLRRPGVKAVSCDLGDPGQVGKLVRDLGSEWSCCVFLAAKVDIPWSVREPGNDCAANVFPLLNLLKEIRAERFIFFSSGAVYDGLQGEVNATAVIAPTLPYAISKAACERYVEFFHRRRGSIGNYLNVRFFGAYGPYEAPHKIYSRLVRAFAIEGKRSYELYGAGTNLIDALYVEDAVDALLRMVEGRHWNRAIDLAGGQPLTVETLARRVAAALGVSDPCITTSGVAHESNQFWGSLADARELFGFVPRTGLEAGVLKLRDFLMANS